MVDNAVLLAGALANDDAGSRADERVMPCASCYTASGVYYPRDHEGAVNDLGCCRLPGTTAASCSGPLLQAAMCDLTRSWPRPAGRSSQRLCGMV